jgi:carboxymethylenebutenolidase
MDHLATPELPGPAVLVVHDSYGLLPHLRERCEDLAAAGFVALAPDLYSGRTTRDASHAADLLASLDVDLAVEQLASALARLLSHPATSTERCAAVGYSTGGSLAVRLAIMGALDALVTYYAVADLADAAHVTCPVLALFAEIDDWEPPELPLLFLDALRAQSPRVEDVTYPGTRHSFANTDVPTAAPLAADRAWARTVNFLRAHVG